MDIGIASRTPSRQSSDAGISQRFLERFAPDRIVEAISQLYSPSSQPAQRQAAEQYLNDFQRSELSANLALKLLASSELSPEASLLLAVTLRRRLQKSLVAFSAVEDILKLAVRFYDSHQRTAEMLVRAAVAHWFHSGVLPSDSLLAEAAGSHGPSVAVALVALTALPEEAKATEVKMEKKARANLLNTLSAMAPQLLASLGSGNLARHSPAARLGIATQWCAVCDFNAEMLTVLATSPLLALAAGALAADPVHSAAGAEFLDTLLERSGLLNPCPEQLIDALLCVLASTRPDGAEEKVLLCRLVAKAVDSWRHFFISEATASGPPAAAWGSLLQALVTCSSWGHSAAARTLPAWQGLSEQAAELGCSEVYAPLLKSAVSALRSAAIFPAGYLSLSPEEQELFTAYRRELRDTLRFLTLKPESQRSFIEDLHRDISNRFSGPWEPLEEAIHALSTPAKVICDTSTSDTSVAAVVLEMLSSLVVDDSPLFGSSCHRQLACTFVMCISVYAPILGLAAPDKALLARTLMLARASLDVRECPESPPDAAFPFTVRQDHIGVVCLLRICNNCSASPVLGSPECFAGLCADVRKHVVASLAGGSASSLEQHSTIVLAQAVAILAAHRPEWTHDLLATCLGLVSEACAGGASVALYAATEVVSRCGRVQGEAVAIALAPAWPVLSHNCLDAKALSCFLAAAAEHVPAHALQPLVQLVAGLFEHHPETRTPLLSTAASLANRAGRDGTITNLVAELVSGLSTLAWREIDSCGQASARLRLVADSEVRLPDELCPPTAETSGHALTVSASDLSLIEAWARLVHEAGKHAPSVLTNGVDIAATGLALALRAAASLLAAPARDPPVKSLELLAFRWEDKSSETRTQVKDVLQLPVSVDANGNVWPLGAIVLRAAIKSLNGQMLPTAVGVLVPAARAVFQHGPESSEAWAMLAISGEGFPSVTFKPESKPRAVKELLRTCGDTQKFKGEIKKLCGGKKQTAPRAP